MTHHLLDRGQTKLRAERIETWQDDRIKELAFDGVQYRLHQPTR